jgi:hypothetical protein
MGLLLALGALACGAALTGCGGTAGPRTVQISLVAPTPGAVVRVPNVEVIGNVQPVDAVVRVAGVRVPVINGAFRRPLRLSRGLTRIRIVATAPGFRRSATLTSFRYLPAGTGRPPAAAERHLGIPKRPPPARPMTIARAQSLAHALNLTITDVPGFAGGGSTTSTGGGIAECGGISPSQGLAHAFSGIFRTGYGPDTGTVSSLVTVLSTSEDAQRYLAAFDANAASCARRIIDQVFSRAANVITLTGLNVQVHSGSAVGTDGSATSHITATLTARGQSFSYTGDTRVFAVNQAVITLTTSGVGQPFPASTAQQLDALMVARADLRMR